jgi:hypothetical protein
MAQIARMREDTCSSAISLVPPVRSFEQKTIKEVALNSPNKAPVSLAEYAAASAGNQRRVDRTKAVLPVRISGNDVSGRTYSELVHTLDISRTGVRLGAVHSQVQVGSLITIQYRQHKAEFRVIWTRPLGSGVEIQAGLEGDAQKDLWGL